MLPLLSTPVTASISTAVACPHCSWRHCLWWQQWWQGPWCCADSGGQYGGKSDGGGDSQCGGKGGGCGQGSAMTGAKGNKYYYYLSNYNLEFLWEYTFVCCQNTFVFWIHFVHLSVGHVCQISEGNYFNGYIKKSFLGNWWLQEKTSSMVISNFTNFCLLLVIAMKIAEFAYCGVWPLNAACGFDELRRESILCLLNASFRKQFHNATTYFLCQNWWPCSAGAVRGKYLSDGSVQLYLGYPWTCCIGRCTLHCTGTGTLSGPSKWLAKELLLFIFTAFFVQVFVAKKHSYSPYKLMEA